MGILERAEHLFEGPLDRISLGGQKGVVAFILPRTHLEPVQGPVRGRIGKTLWPLSPWEPKDRPDW